MSLSTVDGGGGGGGGGEQCSGVLVPDDKLSDLEKARGSGCNAATVKSKGVVDQEENNCVHPVVGLDRTIGIPLMGVSFSLMDVTFCIGFACMFSPLIALAIFALGGRPDTVLELDAWWAAFSTVALAVGVWLPVAVFRVCVIEWDLGHQLGVGSLVGMGRNAVTYWDWIRLDHTLQFSVVMLCSTVICHNVWFVLCSCVCHVISIAFVWAKSVDILFANFGNAAEYEPMSEVAGTAFRVPLDGHVRVMRCLLGAFNIMPMFFSARWWWVGVVIFFLLMGSILVSRYGVMQGLRLDVACFGDSGSIMHKIANKSMLHIISGVWTYLICLVGTRGGI